MLEELLDLHRTLRSAGAEHAELLTSIAADETLGELVARRSAGLGPDERAALHGRLRRARARVLAEAQTRLDADRAAA